MDYEKRRRRLQELKEQRPLFSDIFDFYSHLYEFFAGEQEVFITTEPEVENRDLRRREGFPLISGASLQVDAGKAGSFLLRLIDLLARHGREGTEGLAALRKAWSAEAIDFSTLFRACLDRDRQPLEAAAANAGVSPALLEYVVATALNFSLQHCREAGLNAETSDWPHGYCPLCGGLPVMGELVGDSGQKLLHCGTCATSWEHTRLKCSHCGNNDVNTLEYFTAGNELGHRVNVCRKCSCYLKLVDSREAGEGLPPEVEDIATLHLDVLAQKEGFTKGKLGGSS